MNKYVCTTCGTQYPKSHEESERCPICEEERQYVNPDGQSFTTLDEMIRSGVYQLPFYKKNLDFTASPPHRNSASDRRLI